MPLPPATLECLADYACATGENPLWHPGEQALYWTDIPGGRLFRYHPASGSHEQVYSGRPVGGFTFQADGALLLFQDRGTISLWRDGHLTPILPGLPTELDSRFNDVIADPAGRVFCGTMSTPDRRGRLYRLNLDRSITLLLEGIGCHNGMAFTPDRKGFYFTDSFTREIYLFDYDQASGNITNQRVFARFPESFGFPDGCTLDAAGHLWVAFWDGAFVAHLDSTGQLTDRIPIPVPKTASITFGGPLCRDLYITTAGGHEKATEAPLAGALFRLKNAGQGLPEFPSRIQIPKE